MENKERRRYFRVDDEMIVKYKPITQEDKNKNIQTLLSGEAAFPDSHRLFLTLESDLLAQITKIKRQNPEIAEAINILNRKINLIAKGGPAPQSEGSIFDISPRPVNLSACGIALTSPELLPVGQDLQVEIVLLPSKSYIMAYGFVVAADRQPLSTLVDVDPSQPYRISIDFAAIRDDDTEKLIQHIMRKESETLRHRRHLQKGAQS